MSSTTKKLEDTVKALDAKKLKKALVLTDTQKTERQHGFVQEAAEVCLANKGDKGVCEKAIREARDKVQETISLPIDDTSLEGLEEYLHHEGEGEGQAKPPSQMTDEELYESCPECHVADAAVKFVEIAGQDECDGEAAMEKLQPCLDDPQTAPEKWVRAMIEVTEGATCNKPQYGQVLGELTDYLESRDSEILKKLDASS